MKDEWEVKNVTKSGADYDIRVGPVKSINHGIFPIMAALAITMVSMIVFGLTGWGWFVGLFSVSLVAYCYLPLDRSIWTAGIGVFYFVITWLFNI
jgi:hypothetical protein